MNTNASLGMGSCVWRETRRSIVAPLRLSLARPAPAPSIAAFESHRSAGASRLAPLGLVSDTVCPPQLKGQGRAFVSGGNLVRGEHGH